LEKVFDIDFLQKYLYGVFELPSPRTEKRPRKHFQTKAKKQGKYKAGTWVAQSGI
jgi:hypothetical protein